MHIIDLSQTMKDGLQTYKGLPEIHVCSHLSREDSRQHYEDGAEFQIDDIQLIGNSGTYIDSPFHRYKDGKDLAALSLAATVNLPGIVIRAPSASPWASVELSAVKGRDVKGKAVLIETGWCRYFGSSAYYEGHPFLSADAAQYLRDVGAALVGIDSHNIDDTRGRKRPVHTTLLGAEIPIVEHMTNLNALPDQGFRFFAAPIKFEGVGTFPTRAYALMDDQPSPAKA
ncbi:cyclase family protein [Kordiimonas marina]|uniref:cyclase family protein n=1 Tax=Kordiimonas marina TaxID=2872312 RepID=UPI001FF27193|nr:cyclase family protein [Kordiimonas marina]MCJ9430351.1 cyclase family protein [Kordiimonas marina]